MTRVSIVTISFNQAQFLEQALLSVINQDYSDIDYIVVDPGSTDGSRDIIERYRSKISKIILKPDRGPADGLNRGFEESSGGILGFLNSDDLLYPGAVSSAVRFLNEHEDIDVVSGHSKLVDPSGNYLRSMYSDRMSLMRCIYGGVILMQPSTFFRRSIFDRAGRFKVENRASWDGELWLEMVRAGGKFAVVNEFWSAYRIHPDSMTGAKSNLMKIRKTQDEIFLRVVGRRPNKLDRLLTLWNRLIRKILNPADTWERVRRGPVFGRY